MTEIVVIEEPVVEDEFSKQARMKQYLLSFLDPLFKREEVKLNEYIIPSGYRFKYPGFDPYAEAQFDASKMIQNSYFNDFIKPIKNNSWTKLPVYFVEELPTPCTENKVKKGIHVRIRGIGDVQRLEVVIYLTNGSSDSNAMQLELVISNRHTLRSLQLIECNN